MSILNVTGLLSDFLRSRDNQREEETFREGEKDTMEIDRQCILKGLESSQEELSHARMEA